MTVSQFFATLPITSSQHLSDISAVQIISIFWSLTPQAVKRCRLIFDQLGCQYPFDENENITQMSLAIGAGQTCIFLVVFSSGKQSEKLPVNNNNKKTKKTLFKNNGQQKSLLLSSDPSNILFILS